MLLLESTQNQCCGSGAALFDQSQSCSEGSALAPPVDATAAKVGRPGATKRGQLRNTAVDCSYNLRDVADDLFHTRLHLSQGGKNTGWVTVLSQILSEAEKN